MKLIIDNTLVNIIKEQYHLSKHANINISETNNMPDWEREAYISLLIKDMKDEEEMAKYK